MLFNKMCMKIQYLKTTKYVQEVWEDHRYMSKPQAVLLLAVPCGNRSDYRFQEKFLKLDDL